MFLGLNPSMEGEEGFGTEKTTINLPDSQMKLYREVKKLGKPIVFVNVSGSCINLCEPDEGADAVLQCFYGGSLGGRALANILFGKAKPTAKLPVTFYRSDDDLPAFTDYSMENRTYRFFKGKPLYPFGHGLTYKN